MASKRKRKSTTLVGTIQNFTPEGNSNNLPEQQSTSTLTTPYIGVARVGDSVPICQQEYQMTIRAKRHIDRHQASMLLMVLLCETIQIGFDFSGALTMDYLYLLLLGSKQDPAEIRDQKERQTAMLAKLLLSYQQGTWLSFTDRVLVPESVLVEIRKTEWLPSQRTLRSWKDWWRPRKFLELRFVRLESLIDDHEQNTIPYDSYTKGYGNGGKLSRVKKTRYSPELDGESADRPPVEISLLEFEKYNAIQLAIESARTTRIQN